MSNSGKLCPSDRTKKILKIIGTVVGSIFAIVIAYLIYVISYYHRIPDHLVIDVVSAIDNKTVNDSVDTDTELKIVTYNLGFGAYSPSFSFFMDGGKQSWADSKQSAATMIKGAGELSLSQTPDFVLFQEIDIDSTRTYHLNELNLLKEIMREYEYTFAVNYDSPFLLYPVNEPHGASYAGIATFSKYHIDSAERRSLPISSNFNRLLDLDRCYSMNRISVENGRELVIINIHMSAYGSSEEVRNGQTSMLREDMEREYKAGNYVIVGGDFNHNLEILDDIGNTGWAHAYDRSLLADGMTFAIDFLQPEEILTLHDTCRDAGTPYSASSPTVMLDGFIISDNIELVGYESVDSGYSYSDHDPVVMTFILR